MTLPVLKEQSIFTMVSIGKILNFEPTSSLPSSSLPTVSINSVSPFFDSRILVHYFNPEPS